MGDLEKVGKYFINQLTDNLKRPGGYINMYGAMVEMAYFNFGEKLHLRLEDSSNLVLFHDTVGISITITVIKWYPIIKDFIDIS